MSFDWLFTYILPFMAILTVIVFFHELGHYLLARWNGVKVDVFSIGFGKELFGFTDKAGTRWKFSLLPLGGYVKMHGDADAASRPDQEANKKMSDDQRKYSLHHKSVWARIQVSAAGPIANYIFAIIVLAFLYSTFGQRIPAEDALIGPMSIDSPAAAAGIKSGDKVTAVDGESVSTFEELRQKVMPNPGKELSFTVDRDGEMLTIQVTPKSHEVKTETGEAKTVGLLGVAIGSQEIKRRFLESWVYAAKDTYKMTVATLGAVGQMIVGERSTEGLSGPLGIAQLVGKVATVDTQTFLWFMAILSINLGLINILPIPMLDGGHILFYLVEAIKGKPLSEKAQEWGFGIGLSFIVCLMLLSTWNDLVRLEVVQWVKSLLGF